LVQPCVHKPLVWLCIAHLVWPQRSWWASQTGTLSWAWSQVHGNQSIWAVRGNLSPSYGVSPQCITIFGVKFHGIVYTLRNNYPIFHLYRSTYLTWFLMLIHTRLVCCMQNISASEKSKLPLGDESVGIIGLSLTTSSHTMSPPDNEIIWCKACLHCCI
jgi:hypothetical protein